MNANWQKITCAAVAAMMLTACSAGTSSSSAPASSTSASSGDSSITIALNANLMTMDSALATDGTSFIFLSTCMSGLVQNDDSGTPYPDMATYDISDDGLTYTFHIDENANWSNGDPVTADDFVFAWRRLDDPDTASEYAFFLDTIHVVNAAEVNAGTLPVEDLGVEAADDKTFVVHLSLPCGFILNVLSNPVFFPINEAFFESEGDSYGLSTDDLLYNGAYTMTDWQEGASYTFTKNADYIHADEIQNDELTFRIILETQTAMLEYEQGDINVVTLTGEMVDKYKDTDGYHNRLDGTMWYLTYMMEDPNFSNENLRKAIAYSIDRDTLADSVLKDGSVAAEGIIGREFAYGPDGTDFRDTAGTLTAYDPDQAKEYWEKAKEELGDNITIDLYYEDSDSAQNVAVNVEQMIKTNLDGIEVTMTCKPKKTRVQDMMAHNYQLMITRWGPDYTDPQTFMDLFISGSDMNNGLYNNPEYDALVESGDSGEDAADAEKRWQDYIDAEKILVQDDAAIVPLYQQGSALMVTPGITGIIYGTANGTYRHIHFE